MDLDRALLGCRQFLPVDSGQGQETAHTVDEGIPCQLRQFSIQRAFQNKLGLDVYRRIDQEFQGFLILTLSIFLHEGGEVFFDDQGELVIPGKHLFLDLIRDLIRGGLFLYEVKSESTECIHCLQECFRFFSRILVHGEDIYADGPMEFKKVPHRQGHDHDENCGHDEEDGYGMDIPDDQ